MDGNDPLEARRRQPEPQPTGVGSQVDLEETDPYLKRVVADMRRSRARTADRVAIILVSAVVLSLPLYVIAVALAGTVDEDDLARIFGKWYDVVSPLLGAAIGALFGIAIARPSQDPRRL